MLSERVRLEFPRKSAAGKAIDGTRRDWVKRADGATVTVACGCVEMVAWCERRVFAFEYVRTHTHVTCMLCGTRFDTYARRDAAGRGSSQTPGQQKQQRLSRGRYAPLCPGTGGAWSCSFSKVTHAGAAGSPSTCFRAGQFADVHL